ncbi:TasA family protein [Halobaculum litoreum]|uniref:TasA family protein n=1 Tax=Halobaculum litoreum TaxID=3031998 RepID=A0ABD5XV17_9EURY
MVPDLPGTIGRRRLLSSLGVLGAASAASGIGTWALLSDTERTTGSVTAGTLDLRVGDGGTATLAIDDAAPGDAGVATVPVANDGTVAGTLGLTVVDVRPSAPGGGSGADAERSGGPVADVAFRGCGKAVVEFAADAVFPVELDVHERRGNGETVDETRTVEAAETTPATGGRRRTTLTRSRGSSSPSGSTTGRGRTRTPARPTAPRETARPSRSRRRCRSTPATQPTRQRPGRTPSSGRTRRGTCRSRRGRRATGRSLRGKRRLPGLDCGAVRGVVDRRGPRRAGRRRDSRDRVATGDPQMTEPAREGRTGQPRGGDR